MLVGILALPGLGGETTGHPHRGEVASKRPGPKGREWAFVFRGLSAPAPSDRTQGLKPGFILVDFFGMAKAKP